jgi:hypothetical protein
MLQISELWEPKFNFLPRQRIATLGSCFAQHFSRELKSRGYGWFDAERAPDIFGEAVAKKYNYGVFSARTGNIYTAAVLRQWMRWTLGAESVPEEVWEKDGRYFDPFRPVIEPNGFESADEVRASREATLRALRTIITETQRFVFTLGLTEGWVNRAKGYAYAACPGTVAGTFDPAQHAFKNYSYEEIHRDLSDVAGLIRAQNERLCILLTVSPVPLTATASGKHVLTATTYSKSVLRAVAGHLADTYKIVDYFPSYEIVTGTPFQGIFYEANKRSVSLDGVKFVMDSFFDALEQKFGKAPIPVRRVAPAARPPESDNDDDLVCEEIMLESFAKPEQK